MLNRYSAFPRVFVPSRGFLFFYWPQPHSVGMMPVFSSPHGDFSFSIKTSLSFPPEYVQSFRPLTGISLFLFCLLLPLFTCLLFSSPHGDFSFSIKSENKKVQLAAFVFVPSRGFLFFYKGIRYIELPLLGFRPLTGISLFL